MVGIDRNLQIILESRNVETLDEAVFIAFEKKKFRTS